MRFIDIPPISIIASALSASGCDYWPYPSDDDEFWENGSTPRPYRWQVEIEITEQRHSSKKTRKPNAYNGHDVKIGHYVSDLSTGITLKIIEIVSKTETMVVCILEDVLRYNTFKFSGETGIGIFSIPTKVIIYELNEAGLPVIDPIPQTDAAFYGNVSSYFQNMEKNANFVIHKPNHGFSMDQVIAVDPTTKDFVLASESYTNIIGSVSYINFGPDYFAINPIQKIIDNLDYLNGEVGSILYADSTAPSGLSEISGGTPVMIKLRDWTNSSSTGTLSATSISAGSVIEINKVKMSIAASGTANDLVSIINSKTSDHGVIASLISSPTEAQTSLSTPYGEPALSAPDGGPYATATINGVLVTFSVNTVGKQMYGADYALEEDMAAAINATNIPNIVAGFSVNKLIITNTSGGGIEIINVTPDTEGNVVAGPNSGTGVPLSNPASSGGGFVKLEAIDARAINLFDISGSTFSDFGLVSTENGQKAAALYIEQGLRSASVTVVMNIAARNALRAMIGDQAHVLDKGDGEWGLYLYNGSTWILISSQETAKVDADTYRVTIDHTATTGIIGEVNNGTKVLVVTVTVSERFDGTASLVIGDDEQNDRLMSTDLNDLGVIGSYSSTPTHVYSTGADVEIKYYLNTENCTKGSVDISISYS